MRPSDTNEDIFFNIIVFDIIITETGASYMF